MSIFMRPVVSLIDGTKDVAVSGTEVQIDSSASGIAWVIITASAANTGMIVVGTSSIVATSGSERGVILAAGDSITLPIDSLADVYIDATVNGEGVAWLAGVASP